MANVEIVDDNNNVLKIVTFEEMLQRSLLHRGARVIIITSDGKIYFPKRSKNMETSPGLYDVGAGGIRDIGEGVEDCAKRELYEELGIEASNLEFLFEHKHRSRNDNYNIMVYLYVYDGPIKLQKEEVDEGVFVQIKDLNSFLQNNELAPGRKEIVQKLIELKFKDRF